MRLGIAGIIATYILSAATAWAETIEAQENIPGFDPEDSSKELGTILKGSLLQVESASDVNGMIKVHLKTADGKIVHLLCRLLDLQRSQIQKENQPITKAEPIRKADVGKPLIGTTHPGLSIDHFQAAIYEDGKGRTLPYRLFVPTNYDPNKKYPLVLYFHAYGAAQGTDNRKHLVNERNLLRLTPVLFCGAENQAKYPCFFLAPQQPEGEFWAWASYTVSSPWLELSVQLVDSLQEKYPAIDPTRLYVTGISSGGAGAWDALIKFPRKFAAAVPIASGWGTSAFKRETVAPVWVFYGENDKLTCVKIPQVVDRMKSLGGNPKTTVYQNKGHNITDTVYKEPALLPWLFSQKLSPSAMPFDNLTETP